VSKGSGIFDSGVIVIGIVGAVCGSNAQSIQMFFKKIYTPRGC
jgi:hypothetical protein